MLNHRAARLLIYLMPAGAMAQVICALGPGAASYQPSSDQRPASDAMQLARRLNAAQKTVCGSNCPVVALFRNPTAPNAALVMTGGQTKLVYAPQFFGALYSSYGDAGILAVIAHELGHALDDVMGAAWIQSGWTPELRADSWAGCTLAKTHLSPVEMHAALNALAKYPSPSQPDWKLRLPAIRSGYTHCGGDASNVDSETYRNKPK